MNVRGGRGTGVAGVWVWGEERRGGVARRSVNGDESFLCMVVAFREIRDESGDAHTKLSHSLVLVDYGVPLTFSLGF